MEQVSERALMVVQEVARRTSIEHYRLVLNENRKPGITDSKIGGRPYWPADLDYPTDERGEKMLLVLQVNCAEAGLKAPLPEQGMLQWFISLDPERMYGCRGNYDEDGSGCRVVYHETVGDSMTPPDIPSHETVDTELTPIKREVAIDVVTEETVIGVSDGRFNRLFFTIIKEITGVDHSTDKMWYDYFGNEDCLYLEKNLGMKRPCHQMLGYPAFDQEDARRDIELHDTLLFQLASQFSAIDRKELVMWGDMGNGFVFINREDLASRNFSHTYYCWDCG